MGEIATVFTTTMDANNLIDTVHRYLLPYLFGLTVLVLTLKGSSFVLSRQRTLGSSLIAFFALEIGLLVFNLFLVLVWETNWRSDDWVYALLTLVLSALILVYFLRTRRIGASGFLCARWFLGLFFALCFLVNFVEIFADSLYGNRVSLVGCALIMVATFKESQIRCRAGYLEISWRLLLCRLRLPDLAGPQCFECGYLLFGLTSRRCPECGLAFDPAEHGLDAENPVSHSTTCEDR
ncbi:MAG: hypothetical protein O7D91_00325 [Planctomycetota bacterium]|nr:hypothetical protein [Planctomycetota bacterium]